MSADVDRARLDVLVHEVRSPVAALAAVADALHDRPADVATRPELVRLAIAASEAIQRVVLDVAAASVRFEDLDLRALVTDAVETYRLQSAPVVTTPGGAAVPVRGDPVRLRQAVDNLVANALTHGGGSAVHVEVAESAGRAAVTVRDDGVGIPAHELDRIFEPGVRLATDRPGSGLGLALVRAIVDAHEGVVAAESGGDRGTTIRIELPSHGGQPAT